jgi:hypothetical protein
MDLLVVFERLAVEMVALSNEERRTRLFTVLSSQCTVDRLTKKHAIIPLSIPYVGRVCPTVFEAFWMCGTEKRIGLVKEMRHLPSLNPAPHGNTGNTARLLAKEKRDKLYTFLKNLEALRGESTTIRRYIRHRKEGRLTARYTKMNVVFLPSCMSKSSLHRKFLERNKNMQISESTFVHYWQKWFPHLKIRKPATDVCDECCLFKNKIYSLPPNKLHQFMDDYVKAATEGSDENQTDPIIAMQLEHRSKAHAMRDEYERDIASARNTTDADRPIVLAFDFAQNIQLPHRAEQPSTFYYLSLLNCYQFGIVDEEHDMSQHLLYYEGTKSNGSFVFSIGSYYYQLSWIFTHCLIALLSYER